eukprot:472327_1
MGCCSSVAAPEPTKYIEYDKINQCDEVQFFNTLQILHSLCIDGQNSSNYQSCHIKYSVSIPFNNDEISDPDIVIPIFEAKKKVSLCKHICIYVNNINNSTEKNNILRIITLLLKHKLVNNINQFYVLSMGFGAFKDKFSFYCSNNDNNTDKDKINEQYPSVIIENRLYLGDATQSQNKLVMDDLNITHVLNCTKDWSNRFERSTSIKYLRISINDNDGDNIFEHFEKAISFINHGSVVFVHCQAGISRSASIIIAYLMKTKQMFFENAYQYVKN